MFTLSKPEWAALFTLGGGVCVKARSHQVKVNAKVNKNAFQWDVYRPLQWLSDGDGGCLPGGVSARGGVCPEEGVCPRGAAEPFSSTNL